MPPSAPPGSAPPGRLPQRLAASFLLLSTIVAAGPASQPARAGEVAAPTLETKSLLSAAPDFSATDLDGKTYRLSELLRRGPVLLGFWTTWCKPCMQEIPEIQKIWEKHRDAGFTYLGVASDDPKTAAKIKPTVQSRGFRFPIVTDSDRRIGNLYNVRQYPTTVVIAPDGKIALFRLGYTKGAEKEIEERVVALLRAGAAEGHR